MRSRNAGMMAAALAMAALAVPEGSSQSEGLASRRPRTGPSRMRRATVRPWNARENERRQRQIARGTLHPNSIAPDALMAMLAVEGAAP